MQVAPAQYSGSAVLSDGDAGWTGVDSRGDPSAVEPGFLSYAENISLTNRVVGLRSACIQPIWGMPLQTTVVGSVQAILQKYNSFFQGYGAIVEEGIPATFNVGGIKYVIGATVLTTPTYWPSTGAQVADLIDLGNGQFFWGTNVEPSQNAGPLTVNYTHYYVAPAQGPVVNLTRFNDPDGIDCLLLASAEIRDDGGSGQVSRIIAGNMPADVSLNGHDIWGPCRMVQGFNAIILLRHGPGRHYFKFSDVNVASGNITLHVAPDFNNGTRVTFYAVGQSSIGGITTATRYFAKVTGVVVKLYADSGLTVPMALTSASGSFFLQRDDINPGPNGIGAVPLILQRGNPAVKPTAWDNGFLAVPTSAGVVSADPATEIISVPEHRLVQGDAVQFTGGSLPGGVTAGVTYYTRPVSDSAITVHATSNDAMANINPINITSNGTGVLAKVGSSALAMPPGREAIYYKGRLVMVTGKDKLAVSDVLDPLHYAPFQASVRVNQGDADDLVAVASISDDALVCLKERSILAITGLSGPSSGWSLKEISREYGCIAPLSVVQVGSDIWFLSNRGVVSVAITDTGLAHGVAQPVSVPIEDLIARIDSRAANKACAVWFRNRYLLAVPFVGQDVDLDAIENNAVLVYNFLNQSWEGVWTGDLLKPVQFARHSVSGEEVLCWADASGAVHHFSNGLVDGLINGQLPIHTKWVTRGYDFDMMQRKAYAGCEVSLSSWAPEYSVSVGVDGFSNELELVSHRTKSREKSYIYNGATDGADTPGREDYSYLASSYGGAISPGPIPIEDVGDLNRKQTFNERYRFRRNGRYCQIKIESFNGFVGSNGIRVSAMRGKVGGNIDK